MSAPLLAIDGLACQRGGRLLWRGYAAMLAPGDALHVTGTNGIGKSSLLRMVAGLLPAYAGTIQASGPMALVDEALALDRDQPLARALTFWARLDGGDAQSVASALERLAIRHLADVPVRILSTGQKKRAALARVLAAQAPLWLLDEPGNGLDRDGVALLEALIAAHRASGGAVLVASHLPLAMAGCTTHDLADYRAAEPAR